jgi:hypothetical protein
MAPRPDRIPQCFGTRSDGSRCQSKICSYKAPGILHGSLDRCVHHRDQRYDHDPDMPRSARRRASRAAVYDDYGWATAYATEPSKARSRCNSIVPTSPSISELHLARSRSRNKCRAETVERSRGRSAATAVVISDTGSDDSDEEVQHRQNPSSFPTLAAKSRSNDPTSDPRIRLHHEKAMDVVYANEVNYTKAFTSSLDIARAFQGLSVVPREAIIGEPLVSQTKSTIEHILSLTENVTRLREEKTSCASHPTDAGTSVAFCACGHPDALALLQRVFESSVLGHGALDSMCVAIEKLQKELRIERDARHSLRARLEDLEAKFQRETVARQELQTRLDQEMATNLGAERRWKGDLENSLTTRVRDTVVAELTKKSETWVTEIGDWVRHGVQEQLNAHTATTIAAQCQAIGTPKQSLKPIRADIKALNDKVDRERALEGRMGGLEDDIAQMKKIVEKASVMETPGRREAHAGQDRGKVKAVTMEPDMDKSWVQTGTDLRTTFLRPRVQTETNPYRAREMSALWKGKAPIGYTC